MKSFFVKNFHPIGIPPLFYITLFFVAGIIWHSSLTLFLIIFVLSVSYATVVYIIKQIPIPKQLIICSFFTLFGAWLHEKEIRDYNDFYTYIENKKFTVSGTVIDIYQVITNYKTSTVIAVAVDTIATKELATKNNKTILFYTKSNKNICVGDTVTFFDICCKKPSNESFQHYQIKEQIIATIFNDTPKYTIENHPTWSLRHWIWEQKKRLLDKLSQKLSSDGFKFFSSLFLGNRTCVKRSLEETNEQFKIWGISHFLARSGLHLALFIFIWQAIFRIIPLPLIIKQIIILLLSCIYFILTWTSAPFTRSFALFLLNKSCFITKTSFHLLHYLTLVFLSFLLYCPLYLFFLDFQLSFALTFALAWFSQLSTQHKSQ